MKKLIVIGRYDEDGRIHAFLKNRRNDSRMHVIADTEWQAIGMLVDQNPELFGVKIISKKLVGNEVKEVTSLLTDALKILDRELTKYGRNSKPRKSAWCDQAFSRRRSR